MDRINDIIILRKKYKSVCEFKMRGNCMTPTLKEGDILTVDKNYSHLMVGDIIVYYSDKYKILAHRIYKINDKIQTKADSFIFPDSPIDKNQIIGKVISAKAINDLKNINLSYLDIRIKAIELANLSIEDNILDIGTGAGSMVISLIEKGFSNITTIDHNHNSLEIAKNNFSKLNTGSGIEIICMDALEFHEYSKYNAIFLYHSFHHFPYPKDTLNNIIRNMKKNTVLIIIEFTDQYLSILHTVGNIKEKNSGKINIHPLPNMKIIEMDEYLRKYSVKCTTQSIRNEIIYKFIF